MALWLQKGHISSEITLFSYDFWTTLYISMAVCSLRLFRILVWAHRTAHAHVYCILHIFGRAQMKY